MWRTGRTSSIPRFAVFCRTLIGWFAVTLGNSACAESKYLDAFAGGHRPLGFYSIVSETDPSACQAVLLSLNKEYRISDDKLDENPRVSVESDLLLGSDLQVPWTRKLVPQPHAESYGTSSLDFAQVALGGRKFSLFRRGLGQFVAEIGATLTINKLWISAALLPSSSLDRTITREEMARIHGAEILVDVTNVRDIYGHPNLAVGKKRRRMAQPALLNVVSVKGNLYLLAVDGIQAEIAAPRSKDGTIDLYVLQLRSESDIRAFCHFRSN
jgi:hypothetical protein